MDEFNPLPVLNPGEADRMVSGTPLPINPLNEDVAGGVIDMAPRYVIGTPGNFRLTSIRPDEEYGSWDSALGQKFSLTSLNRPRGAFGGNEEYTNEALGMVRQERGEGTSMSAGEAAMSAVHAMNPLTSGGGELRDILARDDREFNAKSAWDEWTSKNQELSVFLGERGFDFTHVQGARNRDALMLGVNMELTKAQLEGEIDDFTHKSGWVSRSTNAVVNFALADLMFDSDTLAVAPLAVMGKVTGAAQGVHGLLAKQLKLGRAGALALEGGAYGLARGFQEELAAKEMSDLLEGEDSQEIDMNHVLVSGALGAGAGLGLYTAALAGGHLLRKTTKNMKPDRQKIMAATGIEDQPIAILGATAEGIALQSADDKALAKVNKLLTEAVTEPDQAGPVGWIMSRTVIESTGRSVSDVGAMSQRLLAIREKLNVSFPPKMIDELMGEYLSQGRVVDLTDAEQLIVRKVQGRAEVLTRKGTPTSWRELAAAKLGVKGDDILAGADFDPKTSAGRIFLELESLTAQVKPDGAKAQALTGRMRAVYPRPVAVAVSAPITPSRGGRLTPGQKKEVLDNWYEKSGSKNPIRTAQAFSTTGKVMQGALGRAGFREMVVGRTGVGGFYSQHDPVTRLYSLMADPVTSTKMGGRGTNLEAAAYRGEREFGPVAESLMAARQKMSGDEYAAFNDEVRRALDKNITLPADHKWAKEGNEIIRVWQRHMDDTRRRGVQNGSLPTFQEKSIYVPGRLHEGKVRNNMAEASRDFGKMYREEELLAKRLNNAVLERMGWVKRSDQNAKRFVVVEGTPLHQFREAQKASGSTKIINPKKDGLSPADLDKYTRAIDSVDEKGKTIWDYAGVEHVLKNMGRDTYRATEASAAKEWAEKGLKNARPRSTSRRRVTQSMLLKYPDVARWYENDLLSLGMEYARSTGAKVHIQEVVFKETGRTDISAFDMVRHLEQRAKAETSGNLKADTEISGHVANAYEKLAEMIGGMPSAESSYAGAANYLVDTARRTAFTSFSGGLGFSMTAEIMANLFSRVVNPRTTGTAIVDFLRSLKGKDELRGTIMALQMMGSGKTNRTHTGSLTGTYAMTPGERWAKPWQAALDTTSGKTAPPDGNNRILSGIALGHEALNDNIFRSGLGYKIDQVSKTQTLLYRSRDAAKLIPAAKKLRESLKASPIADLSRPEDIKKFKGMARQAGFGSHLDALHFVKHDLMDEGILEAVEAGMLASGQKKLLDLHALEAWSIQQTGPGGDVARDAHHRAAMMLENMVRESVPNLSKAVRVTDTTSRTSAGRMRDMFADFVRAFYINKVLNATGMPGGKIMGGLATLYFAELLRGKALEVMQGRSIDDIALGVQNDPLKEFTPTLFRIPFAGVATPWMEMGVNYALAPERAYVPNPLAGPGAQALRTIDKVGRFGSSMIHGDGKQWENVTESTANSLFGMNWMTGALYNTMLSDAMGLAEQQDKRTGRRFGVGRKRSQDSNPFTELDQDTPSQPRPEFQEFPDFNLTQALMGKE